MNILCGFFLAYVFAPFSEITRIGITEYWGMLIL